MANDGNPEKTLPPGFEINQAESAAAALLKFSQKSKDESLFMDAPVRVLLDVKALKTPTGNEHFYNIRLPFAPYPELGECDVLLVIPDVPDRDPDHVVGDAKDELLSSPHSDKIKVREILTLKQFRDDYKPYEAKRALCKSVDVVVADSKVWKMIPAIVGREFMKKKKFPLSIPGRKFKKQDLAEQIFFAMHKTVFNLSTTGRHSTLVVGYDNLTATQLAENIAAIVSWLSKEFPGGWKNIEKLSVHIGERNMPPLPIYISTETANIVRNYPKTEPTKRKEAISGEISTLLGKRVKIDSVGNIKVDELDTPEELDKLL